MTSGSRTALFAKLYKVLKKHYKPVTIETHRSVLDHLLFACVLEDSPYEAAEEAFASLVHTFFDWNEVRVTSIAELSEVMAVLPDPRAAGHRLKRILHAVFETSYSFDLEDKLKKNLGPTVKWFEKLDGCSRFAVGYILQAALAGHAIPIDTGTMHILRLLELVSQKDAESGNVPGLERAIAKSKGMEFASLLHQLGADYTANPYSPKIREILGEIDPACVANLPKRRAAKVEKPAEKAEPKQEEVKPAAKAGKAEKAAKPEKAAPKSEKGEKPVAPEKVPTPERASKAEKPGKAAAPAEKAPAEKAVAEKVAEKVATGKPAVGKHAAEKPAAGKQSAGKQAPVPTPEKQIGKAAAAEKAASEKAAAGKAASEKAAAKLAAEFAAQKAASAKKKSVEPTKTSGPMGRGSVPEKASGEKKRPSPAVDKPAEFKPQAKGDVGKRKSPLVKIAKKKPR